MYARERFLGTVLAVVLGIAMLTGVMVVVPDETEALPEDAWVRGVVDDGADPIADVYVKVMLFSSVSIDIGYDITDASGEYLIGLPGGFDYMLLAANGSYYMSMTSVKVMAGETVWANLTLQPISPVEADVTVKGYVKYEDGSPAPGGHVLGVSMDPTGDDMPVYANVTVPEADGYFEVNIIESDGGGGAVAFDYPGYPMGENITESAVTSGETHWLNITLMDTSSMDDAMVHGQVTDAGTGLPIEGVLVSVDIWSEALSEDYSNYTFTDSSGFYEMNVTSGEADIWMMKGGYTMAMFQGEWIGSGTDRQIDAALRELNCVVRGNVTDLKSGLPIDFARVVLMDSDDNMAMTTTDSSGSYELDAFDGSDMWLVAQADGYSQDYTFVTLSPSDEVWYDFGLLPVSSWIEGVVKDAITGLAIEGAWVSANSDAYSQDDNTNETGYYNISVVPGDYTLRANAMDYREQTVDVTVPDEATVVQNISMVRWDVEETCLVSGTVTDSVSTDPIVNARVRVAFADLSYQNMTWTDGSGAYAIHVAPLDGMMIGATAYAHAPAYDTLDCAGLVSLALDFQLDPDMYGPNLTYDQSPLENVSWTNPMSVDAEAQDLNMRQILLFNFMPWYSNDTHDFLYLIEGASVSFDPFEPSSGLPYSQVGDVYTVHDEFNGTLEDANIIGGWVGDGTGESYVAVYKQWWGPEMMYAVRACYSNDTLTEMPGAAFFDPDTGEYLLFHFDWGMPEAYPDDASGVVGLMVSHIAVNRSDATQWNWLDQAAVAEYGVAGLAFSPDTLVPSGTYAMLFGVSDFGDQGMWFVTPYTVDNELPAADAGPDQSVVVDTVCTLDGSGSSDNVGIANYTWEFDDGVPVARYDESFDYTFTAVGDYVVTLTVTDGAGHVSVDSAQVTVSADAAPVANAGPDQEVDEDTLVEFDGSGSSDDVDVVSWTWAIPSLSVDMDGVSPTYTFPEPGVYTVELVVSDTIGQDSEVDSMVVTVLDVTEPVADAGTDQDVSFGDVVTFDGSGSSDNVAVASYEWTFDDDGPEALTGVSPTYTFSAPGVFTVTLTVADAAGNEDVDTMTVTVVDDEAPVADAGADPVGVAAGDVVWFDASTSSDNVGIVNYTWNFTDDGDVVLYGAVVDYVFGSQGDYTVTLTVMDAAGLSDTDTVVVRVSEAVNEGPDADAGDDITATAGDTVEFDGAGSSDDVAIATYTWTFEYDGELRTLNGIAPEFVFEIPGTYVVTLNVTDAEGESDTDTVVVIVEDKASTFFTEYWWVLAALAAIIVIVALVLLMGRGKGASGAPKPEDEGEELEEDELPPPDQDEV